MPNSVRENPILILGGGISGLATAYFLKKRNRPFLLFEKSDEVGGVFKSSEYKNHILDFGPNSIRDKNGLIQEIVSDLGLEDEMLEISESFKTRYLLKEGNLKAVSSPLSLLKSDLISWKGKLKALSEVFKKAENYSEESVGSFFERRFGKEIVDQILDPVLSGIYAGKVSEMSMQQLYPDLINLERDYGSVIKGFIKKSRSKQKTERKVINFKKGISQFTSGLYEFLKDDIIHEEVLSITKKEGKYFIKTSRDEYLSEQIISCLPSYVLAKLVEDWNSELSSTLSKIKYAPLVSTQIAFESTEIKVPKSGFGFLVPSREKISILGAIWKSAIFENHATPNTFLFNILAGGSHYPGIVDKPISLIEEESLRSFSSIMKISAEPKFITSWVWGKAIPQFSVQHPSLIYRISAFEAHNRGFYVGGNFIWGVSIPDCIEKAKAIADEL